MTLPVRVRRALGICSGDSLVVSVEGSEIRLQKVEIVRPLDSADPIWKLIGAGESGESNVSEKHDEHFAAGEVKRWQR
jgi:transcriptional pleiotropic regulator of transition state genes